MIVDLETALAAKPRETKATLEAVNQLTDLVVVLGERIGVGHTLEALSTVCLRVGLVAKSIGCDTADLVRMIRMVADAIEPSETKGNA